MSRILNEEDVRNIIYGGTLLGTGGGGSLRHALKLLEQTAKKVEIKIEMVDPKEMRKNDYAGVVAGIGAPTALEKGAFGPEALYAYRQLRKMTLQEGKDLTYVMPVEIGGFNMMIPLYVAAFDGFPIVDADGAGRAVPELGTTLFALYDVFPDPLVLAGNNGDIIVARLTDHQNHGQAEVIARNTCMAYGMLAGLSSWVINKENIIKGMATGTLSQCLKVGAALQKAKNEKTDPVEEIKKEINCKELFRGIVEKKEIKTESGFDFGTITIKGLDCFNDLTYSIDFKNEYLMVKNDEGKVIITVPDLICTLELDNAEPQTSESIAEGMKISVIGLPAHENWKKAKEGYNVWMPILEKMGYNGSYVELK